MARITNPPQGIILSSTLGDIILDVDGTFIDVALTDSNHATIYHERYYAYDGKVTLCDLTSLIETDMRTTGVSVATYYLELYSSEQSYEDGNPDDYAILSVLYCDRFAICNDASTFLGENFLTTLQMRRIAPDGAATLYFYAKAGEFVGFALDVTYRTRGATVTQSQRFANNENVKTSDNVVVRFDIVPKQLLGQLLDADDCEIVSITANAGQRSATFFVDESLGTRPSTFDFQFRNCFNILEDVRLSAVTTVKTDVDRSTAIIGGKSQFYNQSSNKTYEVQSAGLTSDEAEWMDQLFTSHEVFRFVDGALLPILITDSTCELHDGDDSLNTVKFTWRYTDNRPMVLLSASQEIFSDNYDNVYS